MSRLSSEHDNEHGLTYADRKQSQRWADSETRHPDALRDRSGSSLPRIDDHMCAEIRARAGDGESAARLSRVFGRARRHVLKHLKGECSHTVDVSEPPRKWNGSGWVAQ